MRRRFWLPALLLAGCAGMPAQPALVLGPAGSSVPTLTIRTARHTQAIAHAWKAGDVYEYDVDVKRYNAASDTYEDLPTPMATVLLQKPAPQTQATFPQLQPGEQYEAVIVARGDASGTASDTVLNAAHPATTAFDLSASPPLVNRQVTLQLDDVPFALSIVLPSNVTSPGSVPSWVTQLDATLQDASGTPGLTASYTPNHTATIDNARGGVHYALSLKVHSNTGTTVSTIPDFYVPRADGTEQIVTPSFPPLVPPTGTLLATYNLGQSSFGIAVDPQDHLWVTNQHDSRLSEYTTSGQLIASDTMGSQPRGVAIDPSDGAVWVANFAFAGDVRKILGSQIAGPYAVGFLPGGVAVDGQHRVWTANLFGGNVSCLTASGTAVSGSPFFVGGEPSGLAVDPGSGDVWVTDTQNNDVFKISSAGVVSGPFSVGAGPGGVAVDANHDVWVANNSAGTVSHLHADGSLVGTTTVGGGLTAIGVDPLDGGIWVLISSTDYAAKLKPDGSIVGSYSTGGVFPSTLAFDQEHHVWIAGGGSLAELAP
ncbi:MAG TPA: NHL repeat-containing protein [Oscillatoriaceae cyanobacterium]